MTTSVHHELSQAFLETRGAEAAIALESRSPEDAAAVLSGAPPRVGAEILASTSPDFAVSACRLMEAEGRRAVLATQPLDVLAGLLRRMSPEFRQETLESLPAEQVTQLLPLLRYPENTAGTVMDPHVLGLWEELLVADAVERIRRAEARVLYNVYVVDRENVLTGVLNLQELLVADPKMPLTAAMVFPEHRLRASTPAHGVVGHPGWRDVSSMPVVDEQDVYLGAVRYRTLRRLEAELVDQITDGTASPTARALGDLFGIGLSGLIEALAGGIAPAPRPGGPRP